MKKLTFFLLMLSFSTIALAQEDTQWEYCQLSRSYLFVIADYGQGYKTTRDDRLKDENGEAIKFNSMVDALNFMGNKGWELVFVVPTSGGSFSTFEYLLKRPIKQEPEE